MILLFDKRSHFWVQKKQREKAVLHPTKLTKRSMAPFNVAIKEVNLKIGALCDISLRDFPLSL